MTALLARYRGTIAAIVNGIAGVLSGPTTITTSTAATATAYSNQRKVDRCQNGVLWAAAVTNNDNGWIEFSYSADNGATWTLDTTKTGSVTLGLSYTQNFSFFIDLDDFAHLVYKSNYDGYIYYRRGTPNAGRTAWTWSAPLTLRGSGYESTVDYPDVVAHREGTGWVAHAVVSRSNTLESVYHHHINITSGGVATLSATTMLGNYANTNHRFPSIDFNHTGDGKTVAGSTPHLYVAWSAGATGAGNGIRFKKATYSGGSWTWGTEREIDSTRYWTVHAGQTMFDGTRVVIAVPMATEGANGDIVIYERDAADTTTTTRILVDNAATTERLLLGSASYDGAGNVYLLGRNHDEAAGTYDLVYRKWTRATTTLGPEVVIDAGVGEPYVSAKRGYSNNRIEFIYTDGTSSPYNVVYGGIS